MPPRNPKRKAAKKPRATSRVDPAKLRPAQLADRLYAVRQERYEMQRCVDDVRKYETALEFELNDRLKAEGLEGVVGRLARCERKRKPIARVVDWDEFYAFVRRRKAFHLMQRRVNEKAIFEILESGKTVDGVETEEVIRLSVGKK